MVVEITTIRFSKISTFYFWFLEDLQERIEVMKYHLNYFFFKKSSKAKTGSYDSWCCRDWGTWDAPRRAIPLPTKRTRLSNWFIEGALRGGTVEEMSLKSTNSAGTQPLLWACVKEGGDTPVSLLPLNHLLCLSLMESNQLAPSRAAHHRKLRA